jgi:hypothetical protein
MLETNGHAQRDGEPGMGWLPLLAASVLIAASLRVGRTRDTQAA